MSDPSRDGPPVKGGAGPPSDPTEDGRKDWKVVLQFFLVPLSLVAVLVAVFFGLQVMRSHRPDSATALRSLEHYEGFLARYVGEVKRWQSGYDLSLLLREKDAAEARRVLPEITTAFREAGRGDLKVRRYLTLALASAADPRALEPLREGVGDPDAETRVFACWGLIQLGGAAVLPDLRAALGDADPGVREAAAFGLGRLGDREAAPALRVALEDRVEEVRWNAALALARIGDAAAAPVLAVLLDGTLAGPAPAGEREGAERRERALNALRGLALLCDTGARKAIERAAVAGDPAISDAARLALEACSGGARGSSP
jgi:HEAT repeat protein